MRIVPVACLQDNYAYLVITDGGEAAIVDASEAAPVRDALKREGAKARAIWTTHHHWDHVGGNEELAKELGLEVVAHVSDEERVPAMTRAARMADEVAVVKAGTTSWKELGDAKVHLGEQGVRFGHGGAATQA